jgi:AcrR family transcriptional regulator
VSAREDVSAPLGRRAEVLAVAADLFERYGYAGTSLRLIADRAGILPGSVYHHVESKEAVAIELIEAEQQDFAVTLAELEAGSFTGLGGLRAFGRAVAGVSQRHRAAVNLCLFDAPTAASPRLATLVRRHPPGHEATWRRLVAEAAAAGELRVPEVDAEMLGLALQKAAWVTGVLAQGTPAEVVADTLSDILLRGLLADGVTAGTGTSSPAVARVVARATEKWAEAGAAPGRRQEFLEAARGEFARRGFEATTMRDVAEAAGTGAASLYRYFPSKAALLTEILGGFSTPLLESFREVAAVADDPVAALDGLLGLMSLASEQFGREYEIVKAWWRVVTSDTPHASLAEQQERFAILRGVLAEGIAAGVLRPVADLDLVAVCVREILWTPFHEIGVDSTRVRGFFRATLESGAATR